MSGQRRIIGDEIELLANKAIIGPLPDSTIAGVNPTWKSENTGRRITLTILRQTVPSGLGASLSGTILRNIAYTPDTQRPAFGATPDTFIVPSSTPGAVMTIATPHCKLIVQCLIRSVAIGSGTLSSTVANLLMPTYRFQTLLNINGVPQATDATSTHIRVLSQSATINGPTADQLITSSFTVPGASNGSLHTVDLFHIFDNLTNQPVEFSATINVLVF